MPITHFHNTGRILHYSNFPFSLDLSFLFASCGSLPFHLSFIPISRPSPPLIQLGVWGSAVSSPSGPGRSPAAKCNLVSSGPRNERFLTCQSDKLQCSLTLYRVAQKKSKPPPIFQKIVLKIANEIRFLRKVKV